MTAKEETDRQPETASRFRSLKFQFARNVQAFLDDSQGSEGGAEADGVEGLAAAVMKDAAETRATDVHLEPENGSICLRLRVDGVLQDAALLPGEWGDPLRGYFKNLAGLDPIPLIKPANGSARYRLDERTVDLRVVCAPTSQGEKTAIRILYLEQARLRVTELGFSDEQRHKIENWLAQVSGMFLVVGAIGSGKTTTLYSLLHELRLRDLSVVTIEDPIEYQVAGVTQMQVNETRNLTFAEGVKTMLRLDPDFLMVGEIRDPESAAAAQDASATGKVVLNTLHSRDAAGAITALRNYGIEDHEIATALELVISQRLVRRLCPECRKESTPSDEDRTWLESLNQDVPTECWQATGCDDCRQTGYRGRIGLFEIWRLDRPSYDKIIRHADEDDLRRDLRENGITSMLADGMQKVATGETTLDELKRMGGYGFARPDR